MNAHLSPKRRKAVATLALLFVATGGLAADPVRQSFDRMLAHQAGPGAIATPAHRDIDPLIAAVTLPLREGVRNARAADPVAESFARMLAHMPGSMGAEHVASARLENGCATVQPR